MANIVGTTPAPSQPSGGAGDVVIEGSDRTFPADVLQASMTTPVIVDFWAPWCGPCRQLGPAIEAAVRKAKGAVKLVKINVDENPAYAGQLRVQSIPAVYAFSKGRPVDGFLGALPASDVEAFVKRVAGAGPDPAEVEALLARARESLDSGDPGGAAQDFALVLQLDQQNLAAVAGLARCYIARGEPEQARAVLDDMVPEDKRSSPEIQGVLAALELAGKGVGGAELAALDAAVAQAPGDHAKRLELAQALAARGDLEAASDHLLRIIAVHRDWNDGAARNELLKLFEAAGPLSKVTKDGRRRLSSILFS